MRSFKRFVPHVAIAALGITTFAFAATVVVPNRIEVDSESVVINKGKGWATALKINHDRGLGISITGGNKQMRGIKIKSGSASIELNPSYVASGLSNSNLGFSSETGAVVFKVDNPKGADGYVALDVGSNNIYWLNANKEIVSITEPNVVLP